VSNVSDGLCMVIARSRHRRHVFVERQTPIEHDPQHFDIIGYIGRLLPRTQMTRISQLDQFHYGLPMTCVQLF